MMEHAGRAGLAGDRADARRDHHCGGLPTASVGSHLSALRRRYGRDPEPVLRPAAVRAAAAVVRGGRLERERAPRPPPPPAPHGAAPPHSLVMSCPARPLKKESPAHLITTHSLLRKPQSRMMCT